MPKVIYLACPYSNNPQKRFEEVSEETVRLLKEGYIIFSPIVHCHPLAVEFNLRGDFDFWETYDRSMIDHCDIVCVLKLEGWEKSVGTQAEIKIAEEMKKPVIYIDRGESPKC